MQRVLIFSDSLAAPRNKLPDQILKYEETWPNRLRLEKPDSIVAQVSIGSATTEEILYQTQYWTGFDPDVVIFQIGLCDCLPRALYRFELEIVKRLPYSESIHKWIAKHSQRLRELRDIRWTCEDVFAERISELGKRFPESYWLSILVDSENEPVRFPRSLKQSVKYNRILRNRNQDRFLDLSDVGSGCFMSDGFHLNANGHQLVSNRVLKEIFRKEEISC